MFEMSQYIRNISLIFSVSVHLDMTSDIDSRYREKSINIGDISLIY